MPEEIEAGSDTSTLSSFAPEPRARLGLLPGCFKKRARHPNFGAGLAEQSRCRNHQRVVKLDLLALSLFWLAQIVAGSEKIAQNL